MSNNADNDWSPRAEFSATVTEGSPDTQPPILEIVQNDRPTLPDGRTVDIYLFLQYQDDYRTEEGYLRCLNRAEQVSGLLNDAIRSIGLRAYRPGEPVTGASSTG